MRIGLFTDAYLPIISGVSVSVHILRTELEKLGHEVTVVALSHPNAIEEKGVFRFKGKSLPMKGMGEYQVAKVTKNKVEKMCEMNFDVIHCHTEFSMGRLGRKVGRKCNIPIVHTYHTMYEDYVHFISKTFSKPLRFLSKKYSKSFANSSDEVVFPTIKVKLTFDRYGFNRPAHIVPTGIYVDRFRKINFKKDEINHLKTSLGIKSEDRVLLFLGRLSVEKNIEALITQFSKLSKIDNNVKLLFVGGGPDANVFTELVDKLNIKEKVIFVGMVSPQDVGLYYQLANIFVNFSTTETQGLTYIEALASGLPLLVKYDSNLQDVLEDGINGIKFTKDDEFVSAYKKLTSNEVTFNEITTNTTKSIEKFSAKNYALSIEKIYKDLTKKA
jgi:1,2-diacylglycerol 3-alpha-glucosyltransferase